MSLDKLVNEKKVFDAAWCVLASVKELGLNEHERICALENALHHEKTVLDRKNTAHMMLSMLSKHGS